MTKKFTTNFNNFFANVGVNTESLISKFLRNRKQKSGCWNKAEYNGVAGYSDDLLLLSPSLDVLQEMLVTCETCAKEHNLQFSTDVIPSKSKTKCIAFVKGKREIKDILCGNKLPWVDNIKHLGSLLTNDSDMMGSDTMQKKASYINRNNELIQEFYFAHPMSKVKTILWVRTVGPYQMVKNRYDWRKHGMCP